MLAGVTAALVFPFAVMLSRSTPAPGAATPGLDAATDGGHPGEALVHEGFGHEVVLAQWFDGFLPNFVAMAAGEVGDRPLLVTVGLAVQYGAHPAIYVGGMAATIPVSLANASMYHRGAGRIDVRKGSLAGAALFLSFGLDALLQLATGVSVWEFVVSEVSARTTASLGALA